MNINIDRFKSTVGAALQRNRVICRLVAAWCCFAAINLSVEGKFYELAFAQETPVARLLLAMVSFFLVMTVVQSLLPTFETDTWFLMLGASACVWRWLLGYENSKNEFFFTLAVAAAFSLFTVYFVHKNSRLWEKWQPGSKTVWGSTAALGLLCGTVIAVITCLRYMTFSSPNFDFGLFVNMFHYMKETGLPLVSSERDVIMSHFAVHLSPIYYLLLPFYCLFPSPMTIQIGQALVLASGVVPVMLLCKHFKLSGKVTILVTAMYALFPALSSGCFYDIHENCFLTPLLLWLFYFFEREKYVGMYLSAFLVLMVKEDAAIYVILFAAFMIFSRKKYIHGIILAAASLAYFGIALDVLEATAESYREMYQNASPNPGISGPMINRFNNLILDAADGLKGVLHTAIFNPGYLLTQLFTTSDNGWGKVTYFIEMFLPLGLLPFCTKKASRWLLVVPILMNLLTNYKYQYDTGFQYHFGIIAFLIYAVAMNLPDLKAPARRTMVSVGAAICCCFYLANVIPTMNSYEERWEKGQDNYEQMEALLDTLPDDASLAVSSFLLAHVADRDEIYEISYHFPQKNGQYVVVADVDYIVFDGRYAINADLLQAIKNAGYEITEEHKGLITILQKTA